MNLFEPNLGFSCRFPPRRLGALQWEVCQLPFSPDMLRRTWCPPPRLAFNFSPPAPRVFLAPSPFVLTSLRLHEVDTGRFIAYYVVFTIFCAFCCLRIAYVGRLFVSGSYSFLFFVFFCGGVALFCGTLTRHFPPPSPPQYQFASISFFRPQGRSGVPDPFTTPHHGLANLSTRFVPFLIRFCGLFFPHRSRPSFLAWGFCFFPVRSL